MVANKVFTALGGGKGGEKKKKNKRRTVEWNPDSEGDVWECGGE